MAFALYNTLSGHKEPFAPEHENEPLRIYVCGPTVYDYAHLGHARCYIIYDILVRHLRASGQRVKYVRNVTDIDDKIVKRAAECNESPIDLATRFTHAFDEDMAALGNLKPDIEPKVSNHLDDIITLVQTLIEKGHAYASAAGDVYYSVESFKDYGKLSHRKLKDLSAGASGRTNDAEARQKKHPADFALWKGSGDHDDFGWDSPWGKGRPGWHIECSAMSMKHLGPSFDLHGGGLDLVFPHHENEIAQSEGASGQCYARHWMHNGFVEVDKTKMSKSLSNFFTAREIFKHVEPEAIRYFTMTVHYRAPLNLDWTLDDKQQVSGFPQLEEAERRIEYLYCTKQRVTELAPQTGSSAQLDELPDIISNTEARIRQALDDDLNMPMALAHIAELLSALNELCDRVKREKLSLSSASIEQIHASFKCLESSLGLGYQNPGDVLQRIRQRRLDCRTSFSSERIQAYIDERNAARKAKNYAESDRIRDLLQEQGIVLKDGPEGTTWSCS